MSIPQRATRLEELAAHGSVLEYNGEHNWYDAHPIVQQIAGFKDALREIRNPDTRGDAGG